MDACDNAQRTIERNTTDCINMARDAIQSVRTWETCQDCGEEIPLARRQAMPGCNRCVICQTKHEGGD